MRSVLGRTGLVAPEVTGGSSADVFKILTELTLVQEEIRTQTCQASVLGRRASNVFVVDRHRIRSHRFCFLNVWRLGHFVFSIDT